MLFSRVAHIPMGSGFPPKKDSPSPTSMYFSSSISFFSARSATMFIDITIITATLFKTISTTMIIPIITRDNEGGGGGGGCDLEWCEYTHALTEFQVFPQNLIVCDLFS